MIDQIEWVPLSVFIFFFALVTVMGFVAARWKSGPVNEHLDEWGLGGRQFGTWITWFLFGGDFYTAYTVIARRTGSPQAIAQDPRVIEAYLGHGAASRLLSGAAHA